MVGLVDGAALLGDRVTGTGVGLVRGRPVAGAVAPVNANLLVKTEQFDDAAWTKTGSVVVANAGTSPLGDLTADQITDVSGTASTSQISAVAATTGAAGPLVSPLAAWGRFAVTAVLDTGTFTFSVWLKDPTASGFDLRLRIDISGGFVRVSIQDTGDNGIFLAWGAKLEMGGVATGDATNYGAN